jgi:hypothetical protein
MTPQQLVSSLELCQQLKEAGYTQDSRFYWVKDPYYELGLPKKTDWVIYYSDTGNCIGLNAAAAPTVSEMVEWLRTDYNIIFNIYTKDTHITLEWPYGIKSWDGDTLANACAKSVLWVLKEVKG